MSNAIQHVAVRFCRLLGCLFVFAWLAAHPFAAISERPNVLWICADDHAAYVCGAYGNEEVRTPRIDRLAAEGVRFDAAYCNSPVCTASRQSFLTGRYPRSVGVTLLKTPLPERETTLAELLAATGYRTGAIGKMHFNSDLRHGFEVRIDTPDHRRWLQSRGPSPLPEGVDVLSTWRPFRDPARVWLNSACLPFSAVDADMPSTFFAAEAAKFLADVDERPFFLMVSFTEPHSPFHFPVEMRGRHRAGGMHAPTVGPEDDWQIPEIFRDLTVEEKQGIAAAYYTSAEFLDANVGRVLDALDASGQSENTLVIYTGDHGYMLGQHGRFEKHCCYEPAVRAPLLVRMPNRASAGTSTDALVELIDVAPTVLETCGVATPQAMQGRSLAPLLRGGDVDHREAVFVEYSENEEAMIRTRRWKLIYSTGQRLRQDGYATGRPLPGRTILLFDTAADPGEITNLAERPEHADVVNNLTRRLAEHMRTTARRPELVPRSDDVHVVLAHCLAPDDVAEKE